MLETVIASNPSAIAIAPVRSVAVRKQIENAAKKTKIVASDSYEGLLAFASSLRIGNIQAGWLAADVLADAIKRTYADAEGDVAIITPPIDSDRLIKAPTVSRIRLLPNTEPWMSLHIRLAMLRPTRDSVQ
jgi:ABC-type sugar transport system substrate-binding protein